MADDHQLDRFVDIAEPIAEPIAEFLETVRFTTRLPPAAKRLTTEGPTGEPRVL
jgi:hypothetical protein